MKILLKIFIIHLVIITTSVFAFKGHRDCRVNHQSSLLKIHRLDVKTLRGKIKSFIPPIAVVEVNGKDLYIKLGPQWFWEKMNYRLFEGEEVKIYGYILCNFVIPIKITTSRKEIILRDEDGLPLWRRRWGCMEKGCGHNH